jgi:hypothetical protein
MFTKICYLIKFIQKLKDYLVNSRSLHSNGIDSVNARNRDIFIQRFQKRNWRADILVVFAYIGFIVPTILVLVRHDQLNDEVLLICTTMMSLFGSIITDASLFEFGNNSNRVSRKKG